MSEFESIRRTRIASRPIVDPNEGSTQMFFNFADQAQQMSAQFGAKAKDEAAKAGRLAGENSVSINPDGTVSRTAVPDAGSIYTDSYMAAQRTAAKGALETSIRQKSQEFLIKNQNDPDALQKYEKEFHQGYLQPLLRGLHKDIGGQVSIIADQVLRGGINTINDTNIKREYEESQKIYTQTQERDIKTLGELYKAGQIEQAKALEEKIYGDAQDASQTFLTPSGIERMNRSMLKAKVSGQLLADTEKIDPVAGLKTIDKFLETEQTGDDALAYADRVEVAKEAEAQILARLDAVNRENTIRAQQVAPRLHAVQVQIDKLRLQNPNPNFIIPPSKIQNIYREAGFDNVEDKHVWAHYYQNVKPAKDQQDTLLMDRVQTEVSSEVARIETGATSISAVKQNPMYQYYSETHKRALNTANAARQKTVLDRMENISVEKIKERLIETGQMDEETLITLAEQDINSVVAKNLGTLITAVESYKKSPEGKYHKALNFIASGKPIPQSLGSAYDAESEKANYGGSFDKTNPDHISTLTREILITGRVPSYGTKALGHWKSVAKDRDAATALVMLYDQMSDIGRQEELPESLKEGVDKLENLIGMNDDEYRAAYQRLFSGDVSQDIFEANNKKFFGENGDDTTKYAREAVQAEINNIVSASSFAGNITADMIGNSTILKRIFFGANFARLQGEGITPSELQGMFSTNASPSTNAFMEELNETMYALSASGNEYPVPRALEIMAKQGAGMSEVSTFGTQPNMVRFSFEQNVENGGFGSPKEVVQAALKSVADEIQKQAGDDDFGGDWYWERIFDGSIGEDLKEQIGDDWYSWVDNDFSDAWDEGKIKITPYDVTQNVWQIQLQVGTRPDGRPRVIDVSKLLKLGGGTHEIVAMERVTAQRNRNDVLKAIRDPSRLINKLDFSRYDPADEVSNAARLDHIKGLMEGTVRAHEESMQ